MPTPNLKFPLESTNCHLPRNRPKGRTVSQPNLRGFWALATTATQGWANNRIKSLPLPILNFLPSTLKWPVTHFSTTHSEPCALFPERECYKKKRCSSSQTQMLTALDKMNSTSHSALIYKLMAANCKLFPLSPSPLPCSQSTILIGA